jgi:zinc transport system ATP-binding protein
MEKIVTLKDVSFGYDGELILKDINMDIYEGDYLGIVGPNGSAKTTLLKLMLKILNPTAGRIGLFGQDIGSFRDWSKIGYIAQKAASFNTGFPATVEEVVGANLSAGSLFKPYKRDIREKVYRTLEVVGMAGYGGKLIGNLSGGQQQKVFIARTLVNSPRIIFMDEPTVGIDMRSQQEFYELLDRLNGEMGITIAMVSHDIGVITRKASRVACMGDKRLVEHSVSEEKELNEALKDLYGDEMRFLIHNH